MDENSRKTFDEIKVKAEKDKEFWGKAQEDETVFISDEVEDGIMERMFLVYYTEKFLEQQEELERAWKNVDGLSERYIKLEEQFQQADERIQYLECLLSTKQ